MNYYNEYDENAAQWLRELISQGLIPDGIVDTRSIVDVSADELSGFTQCHFFAGIGGWPLALQLAGWGADRPVWTGSCPCQPFSTAGKQLAQADERHLWPVFFGLIKECRPVTVFGEQVASAIGKGWLDGVSADLEGSGYACGATVLGAHSVGAPHIRQRLYWVADSHDARRREQCRALTVDVEQQLSECRVSPVGLADSDCAEVDSAEQGQCLSCEGLQSGRLADSDSNGCGSRSKSTETTRHGNSADATSGWSSYRIAECRDGKFRRIPAESVLLGMADGVPQVVASSDPADGFPLAQKEGKAQWWNVALKGFGNAIVPQVAAEFVSAYMDLSTTND